MEPKYRYLINSMRGGYRGGGGHGDARDQVFSRGMPNPEFPPRCRAQSRVAAGPHPRRPEARGRARRAPVPPRAQSNSGDGFRAPDAFASGGGAATDRHGQGWRAGFLKPEATRAAIF